MVQWLALLGELNMLDLDRLAVGAVRVAWMCWAVT